MPNPNCHSRFHKGALALQPILQLRCPIFKVFEQMKFHPFIYLLGLSSIMMSCQDDVSSLTIESELVTIRYGTSFGFCVGYCNRDLTINSTQIEFVKSGRPDTLIPSRPLHVRNHLPPTSGMSLPGPLGYLYLSKWTQSMDVPTAKAALVGAKTVRGPLLAKTSTKPAA